jgi:RecA/RadA recombinase
MQRNGLDKQDQQIQKPISQVRIDYSKSRIIKKKTKQNKTKTKTKTTNNHVLA